MHTTRLIKTPEKIKRLFSCVLATILVVGLMLPMQAAFAEPTSAEVQAEADEASARLAAAEEDMAQIGVDYQAAVAAHDESVAAMDAEQERIDAAEAVISDTQERLAKVATQQYRQGPYSFLEVLFGAASFEEFVTNWEYINFVNADHAVLIQTNKDARSEAEAAYAELAVLEEAAAAHEAEMADLMARAEKRVAEQEAEHAALSAEAAELVQKEQAARVEARVQDNPTQYGYDSGSKPTPIDIPPGGYGSVVAAAQSAIGTPYISGGTGNPGFDCSGFTQWCYLNATGIDIGRDTYTQRARAAYEFPYTDGGAQPGDVLWWPPSTGYTHVAIYAGGGQFIHAPSPGFSVCYANFQINELIVLRF